MQVVRSWTLDRRRTLLLVGIIVVTVCVAARTQEPAPSSALADAAAAGYSETGTLRGCLAERIDALERKDIYAEPIKALFIDGKTQPVDLMLCVASSIQWQFWYRLDRTAPDFRNAVMNFNGAGTPGGGGGEVRGLRASPDGKYLAVQYSAEGHGSIEVVDLPALVRDAAYKRIGEAIGSYPGSVSIRSWNGGALEVTSDVLLSQPTDGISHLDLLADELFSWDVLTGKIAPLREALRDPVQYYAAALAAPDAHRRRDAIGNLGRLNDESAVALLERRLLTETDTSAREELLDALDRLRVAAAVLNSCLLARRDELRTERIVAEPIGTLFVDGQSRRSDDMLCVANESRDPDTPRQRSWFRVDLASPNLTRVMIQAGNGDPVESLSPSPDGRYLAIRYLRLYTESIAYVEIVDLTALIRDNMYRSIHTIHGYPKSVSIKGWNAGALEVTSDMFLNHPPVPAHGNEGELHLLPLLSEETFSWNGDGRDVVPQREALRNPVHYYCAGLPAVQPETRRTAARGLALLKDTSAVPCLQRALAGEVDKATHAEIRAALAELMQL